MSERAKITELPALIEALSVEDRALIERIFEVSESVGRIVAPEEMEAWISSSFGSLDAVCEQRIIRVTNKITLEGTLFNSLRASRPLDTGTESNDVEAEIEKTRNDPFCDPETGTPSDVFGRVRGEHSVTAANIAKYDAHHAVIVFDDHDPLSLTPEKISDYISVAAEWSRKVAMEHPASRYPFLMWNCLWRAGGSIIHGHAQVSVASGAHYPKVERLRRDAGDYRKTHGRDYFTDLRLAHRTLGLGIYGSGRVAAFANLVPIKEKELVVVGENLEDAEFKNVVGTLLQAFIRDLGVSSFNVAFHIPPLAPTDEDWSGFPVIARIVDRGSPQNRTSDIAAMELYAASVVAGDPFEVARTLRESLTNQGVS